MTSLYYRFFRRETPSIPLPNTLRSLLVELWHLVLSHLDPVSAVCLALSCRSLKRSLGHGPFRQLSADQHAKLDFLTTLSPHLPDHWLCVQCSKWHALYLPFYKYLWRGPPRPAWECLARTGDLDLNDDVSINVADAVGAIRYQKFGHRFGRPLIDYANKSLDSTRWLFSVASKVVRGSLLIKTMIWRDFAADEGRSKDELLEDRGVIRTSCCPHFRGPICMQEALKLRDEVDLTARYRRFQSDLERCNSCASEYLLELERSDARAGSWTFRLSRWLDLGACEHANSPLWHAAAHQYCHCSKGQIAEYDFDGIESVRDRFVDMNELQVVGDLDLARVFTVGRRQTFKMYPVDPVVPLE